ncbi:MAG: hypothetical protein CMN87_03610 [Stappia sp.]|uniref:alpha/beta hydrolase n=1 Tax=Stappia sp. TaxID=1870903 RepID=UPI000C5C826F|nr:alpha/beta hydrolase-fold protein [Stappia sp.]MAA97238.1 hypothetical protein [Stappia sp.]MBM19078.1 hypothetical protein [Stappia sp.]
MTLRTCLLGIAAAVGVLAAPACAAPEAASAQTASSDAVRPVVVPGAREIPFVSSVTGTPMRLLVWQPSRPAPPQGYPLLLAFDGDDTFALLVDTYRSIGGASLRAGAAPLAIAAIAYGEGAGGERDRIRDMTPAIVASDMPDRPNGKPWPETGGGDRFLEMVEREVKPLLASALPLDPGRQTLFGHSLGGLMVLHRLSTKPDAFDCYAASSASLWAGGGRMVTVLADFLDKSAPMDPRPRLILSVGDAEEDLGPWDAGVPGMDIEARRRWIKGNAMVSRARDLAAIVREKGSAKLDFVFREYPGRSHQPAKIIASLDAVGEAVSCGAPSRPAPSR